MQLLRFVLPFLLPALASAQAQDVFVYPSMPAGAPPRIANPDAEAASAAEMKRYVEKIPGSDVSFAMVPIPGGKFRMGSAATEAGRKDDECAPTEVEQGQGLVPEQRHGVGVESERGLPEVERPGRALLPQRQRFDVLGGLGIADGGQLHRHGAGSSRPPRGRPDFPRPPRCA